jgi:uncharacterized protein YcbK (DUF882 family)
LAQRWKKPPDKFATPHFHFVREIACNHCGRVPDIAECRLTAEWLEEVREALGGLPIHVNSWCRCPEYNAAIGGAPGSYHMRGMAVDITVRGYSPRETWRLCKELQKQGLVGGLGRYKSFTHVDRGERRNWNGP